MNTILTISKFLLRVTLCLLSQRKNYGEILKTKEFLTEEGGGGGGRDDKKMLSGANMNLYLHLKWPFRTLSNCFFTTNRAERYSAYKIKVLHSQY